MSIQNDPPPAISNSNLEARATSLFKSERTEDIVAILLAAVLVMAVLAGLRV